MDTMVELEKIAHEAASEYSRCSECNGICKDTECNCDKKRLYACNLYWAGYHTALIAMERFSEQLRIPVTETESTNYLGLKEKKHFVQSLMEYATSDECGIVDTNNSQIQQNSKPYPHVVKVVKGREIEDKPIPSNYGEGDRDFVLGLFDHWKRDLQEFL